VSHYRRRYYQEERARTNSFRRSSHNSRRTSYEKRDRKKLRRHSFSSQRKKKKKKRDSKRKKRSIRSSSRSSSTRYSNSCSKSSHDDTVGEFKGKNKDVINGRYEIFNELGVGTFGRVLACVDKKTQTVVAVKVVRAVKRYTRSARLEAKYLALVKSTFESEKHKCPGSDIVQQCCFVLLLDHFEWNRHYCIVTETLGLSLYNVIKANNYVGFCLKNVCEITRQIILGIQFLHENCKMVHTDLKLENVLLVDDNQIVEYLRTAATHKNYIKIEVPRLKIKLIDFGGACVIEENESLRKSVINTRQYRSPEVTLESGWSFPSDIWSCGCIAAEIFVGDLLFQTHDELEHLALIEKVTGETFPKTLTEASDRRNDFFRSNGELRWPGKANKDSIRHVRNAKSLHDILSRHGRHDPPSAIKHLFDLLQGMLKVDPESRLSARNAVMASSFKIED